jgi:hypothetical protein
MTTTPRTIVWGLVMMLVAACGSSDEASGPGDPPTPEGDVTTPYPIARAEGVTSAPLSYYGLPLTLANNGEPAVTAVDGVIGVVCVGMSNARQECEAFKRRVANEWSAAVAPQVRVVNCAVGGHAIERWISPDFDLVLWRDCIDRMLPAAGVRLDQVRVLHHKAANQNTTENGMVVPTMPAANSDMVRLQEHLDRFADRVPSWFPNVQAVYTTTRSYGGYAPVHRGEPLSYESGHGVNAWLARNRTRGNVWYGWGAYLWAPDCATGITAAGGLCYVRSDFVADGVHPSDAGEIKTSTRMHERFLQHAWYRR